MRFLRKDSELFSYPRTVRLTIGILIAVSLAGCGSGGGGDKKTEPTPSPLPTASPTPVPTTRAQVELDWAARSRVVFPSGSVPASALSADITLTDSTGKQVRGRVNRRAAPDAYADQFAFPDVVTVGEGYLSATFYSQTDGQGDVVAAAQTSVSISGNGQLPGIALTGTVASVSVPADQVFTAFVPAALQYSVRDASGKVLALSPGALFWSQNRLLTQQTDGTFSASSVGDATVSLTVDGITSDPAPVHVTSDTQVAVTPATVPLSPAATQSFTAQVTNTRGGAAGVAWRVVEDGGGQITQSGVYTAPTVRGTYHIEAKSVFDPSKTAQVTVQVQSGSVSGVIE